MTRGTSSLGRHSWLHLVLLGLLSCQGEDDSAQENIIEIGLLVEFDDRADSEEDISKANLVASEINRAGGLSIDGQDYELRIVAEDHKGSAEGGIEAIETLAKRGVSAVVGPPWSSIALGDEDDFSDGAALFGAPAGVLLVSGSATSPDITDLEDDDLMWRTVPSDSLQTEVAAQYLFDDRGMSRAALLVRNEAWGRGLADAFIDEFRKLGGTIVADERYDVAGLSASELKNYQFDEELNAIFEDQPDVILLASFDEVFQITNRIVQGAYLDSYGGSPPLFFGTDATFTDDLLVNGAPDVLRNMEGTSYAPDEEGRSYRHVVDAMNEAGLGDGDVFDAARYDATYCIALAMQSAQSTDAQLIKRHLRSVANADEEDKDKDEEIYAGEWAMARDALLDGRAIDYQGASGKIEFDAKGDPSAGFFVLWKVKETSSDEFEFDSSHTVHFP